VQPTREVFGNISFPEQLLFYCLMAGSLGWMAWSFRERARLWGRGKRVTLDEWPARLRRVLGEALGQRRIRRPRRPGTGGPLLHTLLFYGFLTLFIGTVLLEIDHVSPLKFHRGWYYLSYEVTLDLFGLAFLAGCALALVRRLVRRPASLGHAPVDTAALVLLLAIGVTGYFIEAFRLQWTALPASYAHWSPVGDTLAAAMSGLAPAARAWHRAFWWLHALLIAGFFVLIPRMRLRHMVFGPAHIAAAPRRHRGALEPVTMEEVEQSGRIGISDLQDFTWPQLLSLDACMECGRCHDVCPATATGKPLSPKAVVVDLREWARGGQEQPLHGGAIAAETLWSCTMCQACVRECPVWIGHVDLIAGMRRHLVAEGQLSGPPAVALRRLANSGNPWGLPAAERSKWSEGLDVPTLAENPRAEVLYWVGCAASYDQRSQRVARAFVRLLRQAGVSFAVLGREERCTGDPARRLGDEFLFQELAQGNIETLNRRQVRRIVTACPHCFNTLGNEYPQFGGHYEVVHHSAFLADLVRQGKLQAPASATANGKEPITFHDPCYLARVNGIVEEPREVLISAGSLLEEMPRSRDRSFCCGAGGGRMWMEEAPDQRVNRVRAAEALATGARTVATGCPFCLTMMTDGVAAEGAEDVRVRDIAEIMAGEE
jgi:Fe-S oxidoreductase/nitrate reductase gamma subunit